MNPFLARARTFAPYAIVAAFFAAVLATGHWRDDYLQAQDFAGCYVAANADPLLLAPSGSLRSRGSQVGTFKVLASVGGKHGPLVEATGLNVVRRNGRVVFVSGSGGFYWPVASRTLSVVFAPDAQIEFTKGPNAACR